MNSTSNNSPDNKLSPEVINLNNITPIQSLDIIWKLLNKANGAGVYSIDESYTIKILMEILIKEINKTVIQEPILEETESEAKTE